MRNRLALKLIVVFLAVASASLIFRPSESVPDRPFTEDGFYSLSVSRNIGLGKGIVTGGDIPTNGFQPLFTFLCAPVFAVAGADRLLSLRLIMLVQWSFFLGTGFLLGSVARAFVCQDSDHAGEIAFWAAAALWFSSIHGYLQAFNGLETGCVLFLYALTWRVYQYIDHETRSSQVLIGVLLGLTVLARIDAAFLVCLVCLHHAVRHGRAVPGRSGVAGAAVIGATALAVSLPWWLYNLFEFHALTPTSGLAQQDWEFSWSRIVAAFDALMDNGLPFVYLAMLRHKLGAVADAAALAGVLFAGFFLAQHRIPIFSCSDSAGRFTAPQRKTLIFGGLLVLHSGILVCWYTASSLATPFYSRYFSPLMIPTIVLSGLVIARVFSWWPRMVSAALGTLAVGMVGVIAGFTGGFGYVGSFYYREQVRLVNAHVPEGELVGAGQSGTLGYFRDAVINLDGKVNPDALAHQADLPSYVAKLNLRWVCDEPYYVRRIIGENEPGADWHLIDKRERFILVKRPANMRSTSSNDHAPPRSGLNMCALLSEQLLGQYKAGTHKLHHVNIGLDPVFRDIQPRLRGWWNVSVTRR